MGEEVQKRAVGEEEHEALMEEGNSVFAKSLNVGEAGNHKIMAELARMSARMNDFSVSKSDEVVALKQQMAEL